MGKFPASRRIFVGSGISCEENGDPGRLRCLFLSGRHGHQSATAAESSVYSHRDPGDKYHNDRQHAIHHGSWSYGWRKSRSGVSLWGNDVRLGPNGATRDRATVEFYDPARISQKYDHPSGLRRSEGDTLGRSSGPWAEPTRWS